MRSLFYLIFSAFIISASLLQSVYTQTTQATVDAPLPAGAVRVASVSINDAAITSMEGNKIDFTFTFLNEETPQSGVKYSAKLVKEIPTTDGVRQEVVDEFIFDETLSLAVGETVTKNVSYTAPANLDGGYVLYVSSKNTKNFPFGEQRVGDVLLKPTVAGVSILVGSCSLKTSAGASVNNLSFDILQLNEEETLSMVCTLQNTADTEKTVTPTFTTNDGGSYGIAVKTTNVTAEPVTVAAKEVKQVEFPLPRAEKPGRYAVALSFDSEGAESSVSGRYSISGKSATIVNVTLDKNSYTKGETAQVKILWSSSEQSLEARVSLKSGYKTCAAKTTQSIAVNAEDPFATIALPIKKNCENPTIEVQLLSEGVVLDEQTISFGEAVATPKVSMKTTLIAFGGLIALLLIILFAKKAKTQE